jgi:uncharacterized membrane protein YhaH (DUF805 family)
LLFFSKNQKLQKYFSCVSLNFFSFLFSLSNEKTTMKWWVALICTIVYLMSPSYYVFSWSNKVFCRFQLSPRYTCTYYLYIIRSCKWNATMTMIRWSDCGKESWYELNLFLFL